MTDPIGHYAFPVTAQATKSTTNTAPGTIPFDADFASITSANSAHIVNLPSNCEIGRIVTAWVGANGCRIATIAGSTQTINNVDTTGAANATIPASSKLVMTYAAANTWLLERTTNLGATGTAIVPA